MRFANNTRLYHLISSLLILLLFTGCSIWKPQPRVSEVVEAQPLLSNYWSLDAKVGITSPKGSGSVKMTWLQQGNEYIINFTGPLGKALGTLARENNQVTLTAADGTAQTADSEDQLALSAIGKPLPVKQMQFWIKGIKAPFFPIEPVSATKDSMTFIQRDWHVTMADFQTIDGYKLPKKLNLRYPSKPEDGIEIELKILIKQWDLPAETAFENTVPAFQAL